MQLISYEEFEKVDIRSGTVVKVEPFPRAKKPAYKVWVDFGPVYGIKQTSAQVTVHYTPESLMERQANARSLDASSQLEILWVRSKILYNLLIFKK